MGAKNKNKGNRHQSWMSKIINLLLMALFFWTEIDHFLLKGRSAQNYVDVATGGMTTGSFDKATLLKVHAPKLAAVGLGMAKSYALKKFPIRR